MSGRRMMRWDIHFSIQGASERKGSNFSAHWSAVHTVFCTVMYTVNRLTKIMQ